MSLMKMDESTVTPNFCYCLDVLGKQTVQQNISPAAEVSVAILSLYADNFYFALHDLNAFVFNHTSGNIYRMYSTDTTNFPT